MTIEEFRALSDLKSYIDSAKMNIKVEPYSSGEGYRYIDLNTDTEFHLPRKDCVGTPFKSGMEMLDYVCACLAEQVLNS